jgi:hypothetical protein
MEEIANTVRYLALIALIINWIHKKRSKYIGIYLLPNIECILRIKIMCVQESKYNYSAYQKSGKKRGFWDGTKKTMRLYGLICCTIIQYIVFVKAHKFPVSN